MKIISDIFLLIKSYPIARSRVMADRPEKYPGTVCHMIAYNETRTELVNRGIVKEADITGAIVMVAVGIAYLFNR